VFWEEVWYPPNAAIAGRFRLGEVISVSGYVTKEITIVGPQLEQVPYNSVPWLRNSGEVIRDEL
jgi:hypothetical protein